MIKVVYQSLAKGGFILTSKGHADSGEEGHDLVCAAISAILLGGVNNLKDEGYEVSLPKKGDFTLRLGKPTSEHDNIVIETILRQIECVSEDHPSNVTLERN